MDLGLENNILLFFKQSVCKSGILFYIVTLLILIPDPRLELGNAMVGSSFIQI